MAAPEWRKLPMSLAELCIETTLRCGQSFRWQKTDDVWHCALHGRIISLKQDAEYLHYRAIFPAPQALGPSPSTQLAPPTPPSSLPSPCPSPLTPTIAATTIPTTATTTTNHPPHPDTTTLPLLHHYFSLAHSLPALYASWSATDANFARRAPPFGGIRLLAQDAWEALVCFICSSNNHIARIGQMVHRLCAAYGAPLGCVAGRPWHDFPPPAALAADGVEARLRALGFGYRARYIAATARAVVAERPPGWLEGLRNPAAGAAAGGGGGGGREEEEEEEEEEGAPTYRKAHEALLGLAGVGPKVADCVCLMGLGWGEAVPVDTHVWQIAQRDYRFASKGAAKAKTLTKTLYDAVGDHFRALWGPQAGWAQSVLFTANLPSFADQAARGRGGRLVEEEDKSAVHKKLARDQSLASSSSSAAAAEEEEEEESQMHRKKRRVTADSEVKTEMETEVHAREDVVEVDTSRRTRSRKRRRARA